jgi:hypothetical protein
MESKYKVSVTLAQELIKNVRLLAMSGRDPFKKFLYTPLYESGWHSDQHNQSARKLMERIDLESGDQSFLHTIAPRCKRLICFAMDEGLSMLGDASIFFLEKMQLHVKVSTAPESLEFTQIIDEPLSVFHSKNKEISETIFKKAITNISPDVLKNAFQPVKLENAAQKVKLDSEIKKLYDHILIASKYHNIPKCRKLLSTYITNYSDNEEYAKTDVDRLVEALNRREEGFDDDLKNTIAIELYYKITRGVLNGDIGAAIQGIRKYGYIFEGNADTKHFYDIDRLERILYQMITDKGLWEELKKR